LIHSKSNHIIGIYDMIEFVLKNRKLRLHPDGVLYSRRLNKEGKETKKIIWKEVVFSVNKQTGYEVFNLVVEGNPKLFTRHRVVYYAYNQDWDIFDSSNDSVIDHINRDKTDNRIKNLRKITNQENQFNTDAKGYWLCPSGKYEAYITKDYKKNHIGMFETEEEAATAYKKAKEELHVITGNPLGSRSQGRQGER